MKTYLFLLLLVIYNQGNSSVFAGTGVAGGGIGRTETYRLEYGEFRSTRELESIMKVCAENILLGTQEAMDPDNLLIISEVDFRKLPNLAKGNGILELVQYDGKMRRYQVKPSFSPAMYRLNDVSKMNLNEYDIGSSD